MAFKNSERMESFDFYDRKNKTRVTNVRNLIVNQKENLVKVKSIMDSVKKKIKKKMKILEEFAEIWCQFDH